MEVSENITKAISDPERFPAANVIELKHGSWKVVNKEQGNQTDGIWTERYLQCSVCNYERRHSWLRGEQPPYCENCGSKMDGDKHG
jgi:hypothetical protein